MVDLTDQPELINIGVVPDAEDADTLRVAYAKTNEFLLYLIGLIQAVEGDLVIGAGPPTDWDGSDPTTGTGENGQTYMDTVGLAFYGPRINGIWGAPRSFQGPAGVATNGLPVGGTPGQVIIKQLTDNFAVAWGDVVRAVAGGGVTLPAALADGQSPVKISPNQWVGLPWLRFGHTGNYIDPNYDLTRWHKSVLFNDNGQYVPKLLSIFDLADILTPSEPIGLGYVLTQTIAGLAFAPPAPRVFKQFSGGVYDYVYANAYTSVVFREEINPDINVEMLPDGIARAHTEAMVDVGGVFTFEVRSAAALTEPVNLEIILEYRKDGEELWKVPTVPKRYCAMRPDEPVSTYEFSWPLQLVDLLCFRFRVRGSDNIGTSVQISGPNCAMVVKG